MGKGKEKKEKGNKKEIKEEKDSFVMPLFSI